MHLQELQKLEIRLLEPISIPVIGRCLQKKAVAALAEDASPDAVEVLSKAVISLKDEEIKEIVLDALGRLENQQCIDTFCQVWADTRHQDLTNLLVKKGWIASVPVNIKVLSALKAKQLQVVTDGGREIVEPLLNAFQDKDSEIANRASECATMFDQPEYQELLCRLVIEQDHSIARQVVIKAQYAPREPSQRALFYFLTEQWDKYESLDYEHSLLQTAFEHSNEQLRQKIREQIRKAGRVEWLKVFAGGNQNRRLGEMTNAEWETTLTILDSGKQWEEMWRLAQKAPAIWSKQLLQKLKQVAWIPKVEEEQKGFERLRQLADKCLEKTMPMRKLTSCKATLTDHIDQVQSISFSPNGQLLASSSSDKTIKLWRMPDAQLLATLTDHTDGVQGISFSPDGQLLASSSKDKTIRLWRMPDGKPLATLTGHTSWVKDISFSPDGQLLASFTCTDDTTVRLWQMPDGKPLATLTGHTSWVNGISFSPDGQLLASFTCTDDTTVRLWQMPDGKPLATLTGHTSWVNGISFSPDGQLLASCSEDKTIRLWQMPDGKPLATLTDHTSWVEDISFSPDGQLLASCSSDKTIRLWSMSDGNKHLAPLIGHTDKVNGISFSPDGQLLASYSSDKTIKLWSSPVFQLSHLPIKQLGQHNRESVQKTLQYGEINKEEKNWLEFMQALMNWHQRFDVEVEDVPQIISTGEFDIEIEG